MLSIAEPMTPREVYASRQHGSNYARELRMQEPLNPDLRFPIACRFIDMKHGRSAAISAAININHDPRRLDHREAEVNTWLHRIRKLF